MPPKVITFSNQKGGVGKTTLTREIGIFLASIGRFSLLVDLDPQANLSKSLTDDTGKGVFEALTGSMYMNKEVKPGLMLLSGDIRLASLEKSLISEIDAYTRIRDLLAEERFLDFEYILLDTPPSLGVLAVNGLTAGGSVVIPMTPSLYSMQGTNDLMDTISKVKKNLNPDLLILGVIINEFDSIPVITRQIRSEIEESFGGLVFPQALSKSIRIEEGIAERSGVITMTKAKAKVKQEITDIGKEFVLRSQRRAR